MTTNQEKLTGLQQMQQIMKLAAEGPSIEKLIEEVKQVVTKSTAEVALVQVELGDLRNKITVPTE